MNKLFFLFSFLFFFPQISFAFDETENGLEVSGSFIITAICKDGIIVASDSRVIINEKEDGKNVPIAYIDGEQKIFVIGPHILAVAGSHLVGNKFFPQVIREYEQQVNKDIPSNQLISDFIRYCQKNYSNDCSSILKDKAFISASYDKKVPVICIYDGRQKPSEEWGCHYGAGYYESSKSLLLSYQAKLSFMTCEEVGELSKKSIENFISQKDHWKHVGGLISVLHLTGTGYEWLKNQPTQRPWKTFGDFASAYYRKTVEVYPFSPFTHETLYHFFEKRRQPRFLHKTFVSLQEATARKN